MNKCTLIFQIPKDSDFEFSTRTNLLEILKVFDLESLLCDDIVTTLSFFTNLKGITYFCITYLDIQNELQNWWRLTDEFHVGDKIMSTFVELVKSRLEIGNISLKKFLWCIES